MISKKLSRSLALQRAAFLRLLQQLFKYILRHGTSIIIALDIINSGERIILMELAL